MNAWLRPVRIAVSAAAISAAATIASADGSGPASGSVMTDRAGDLVDLVGMWLARNFELPDEAGRPGLVFAPPETLARLRYGEDAPYDPGEVVAVYRDEERAIYLGEGWDGGTPAELSVLVHEMVHHLQDAAGMRFACPGEREVLAYRAQQAWLEMFGTSLQREFDIDPATLMLRTTCAY